MTESDGQTHTDKLAGEIADAILSGAFPPGFRLDEQSLAQRYNVSRTPVREALRQLAATGLIDIRPRRGAVVAQVTPAQLEELFVAMGEMEATCARLAAIRMTPVERRRLQSLHDGMAELVRDGRSVLTPYGRPPTCRQSPPAPAASSPKLHGRSRTYLSPPRVSAEPRPGHDGDAP